MRIPQGAVKAIKSTNIKNGIRVHYSNGAKRDYAFDYFEYDVQEVEK